MVDHRRTAGQRAYQLPSWFFVLTVMLGVVTLGAVGWVFFGDRLDRSTSAPKASASASPIEPEPEPTTSGPIADEPAAGDQRPAIDVVVLNASKTPGLAAEVADTAKKAGWTVADVGDWIYPAVVNAVYYPEGRQSEADLLAKDVGIASVRPARPGMRTDALTVLLVYSP